MNTRELVNKATSLAESKYGCDKSLLSYNLVYKELLGLSFKLGIRLDDDACYLAFTGGQGSRVIRQHRAF